MHGNIGPRDSAAMIAAVQSNTTPTSHLMSVAKFERFFRIAAGLDVDKQDLKRYSDFVNQKIYDLLLRAHAAAKANGRIIVEPFDLPITKVCRNASTNSGSSTSRSNYGRSSTISSRSLRWTSLTVKKPRLDCLRW
jgi:hypothetical protein